MSAILLTSADGPAIGLTAQWSAGRRAQWATVGDVLAVAATLSAVLLQGSTGLHAQALLASVAVLLAWLPRPGGFLPRWVSWFLLALAMHGLFAFLPAAWFSHLPLRTALGQSLQMALSPVISLQPWVSLEALGLFLAGLLWVALLLNRSWALPRFLLLGIYAGGVGLMALAALAAHWLGGARPAWQPDPATFGFFPNRNQTANLFAITSPIMLGLAAAARARRSPWRYAWLGGFLLLGIALVVTGSRAGILLYFAGVAAWVCWKGVAERRWPAMIWQLSGVLLLTMAFLVFGGPLVDRLILGDSPNNTLASDLHQRTDPGAYRLLRDASWHGIGLGNFNAVFAPYAERIRPGKRAIHPESDWIWAGIEMGWGAPLLILGGSGAWLWRHRPTRRFSQEHLKVAILIALVLWLAHGFVDVAGHRMGSLWPALFLAALLRKPPVGAGSKASGWGLRLASLPVAGFCLFWTFSCLNFRSGPTSTDFALWRKERDRAMEASEYGQARSFIARTLSWAPLDWESHFLRGVSGVYTGKPDDEAHLDFQRARFLEPNQPRMLLDEGKVWAGRNPLLARCAWQEALRCGGSDSVDFYREMLRGIDVDSKYEPILLSLAQDAEGGTLMNLFLERASPTVFLDAFTKLRASGRRWSEFPPSDRPKLLSLWFSKGNREQLACFLDSAPEWTPKTWLYRALFLGWRRNYQAACALMDAKVEAPALPPGETGLDVTQVTTEYRRNPNDLLKRYQYARALEQRNELAEAAGLLAQPASQAPCPAYFQFLAAQIWQRAGRLDRAWQSWEAYVDQARLRD